MHISWIKRNYKGDIYFLKLEFKEWYENEKKEFDEFVYTTYLRKI